MYTIKTYIYRFEAVTKTETVIEHDGYTFPKRCGKNEAKVEEVLTTSSFGEAMKTWQQLHTIISKDEYMAAKGCDLKTLGSEEYSRRYLRMSANYAKEAFWIINPATGRVEKSRSLFLEKLANDAEKKLGLLMDDEFMKKMLTQYAMKMLIGYSKCVEKLKEQRFFDTLHDHINALNGRHLHTEKSVRAVVDHVWDNVLSWKHKNAWRYSRYLVDFNFVSVMNDEIAAVVETMNAVESEAA